jgi:hypothetical protein
VSSSPSASSAGRSSARGTQRQAGRRVVLHDLLTPALRRQVGHWLRQQRHAFTERRRIASGAEQRQVVRALDARRRPQRRPARRSHPGEGVGRGQRLQRGALPQRRFTPGMTVSTSR